MLDTNVVSHVLRGDSPGIRERIKRIPRHAIFVSVVSEAELIYGVLKRGSPVRLASIIEQFLGSVVVLPWHRNAAVAYAEIRYQLQLRGKCLEPLDLMIAAHAKAAQAVLVSRDKSYDYVGNTLSVEDWAD